MEEVRNTIIGACQDFDNAQDIDEKTAIARNIKILADAYSEILDSDVKAVSSQRDHEARLLEIKERTADNEAKRILEDEKQQAEAEAKDAELDIKRLELRNKRKKDLAEAILTGTGTITTFGLGALGLWSHREELIDLLKFEADDKIPVSVAFSLFSKRR